jgi:hypothetical protein
MEDEMESDGVGKHRVETPFGPVEVEAADGLIPEGARLVFDDTPITYRTRTEERDGVKIAVPYLTPENEERLRAMWEAHLAAPQMIVVPPPASLDAAWAEAKALLPEGWVLRLSGGLDHCLAEAFYRSDAKMTASGATEPAALRALAAKLRERSA